MISPVALESAGAPGPPISVQPGARWWVMACGGFGADVPHCARTQKRAALDFFFLPTPLLLSFSVSTITLAASSWSSLYLCVLFCDGEGCEVAGGADPSMWTLLPCPMRASYGLCYFLSLISLYVHVWSHVRSNLKSLPG